MSRGMAEQLSQIATIAVIKQGYVFTLLLVGSGLSNWTTVNKIQSIVLDEVGNKYSIIEAMRNDENYFLLILKPESK